MSYNFDLKRSICQRQILFSSSIAPLPRRRQRIVTLEIGSGSGFISRELALRVKRLIATDINPHAVRATKEKGIEVVRADLFLGIKGKFDLILFNPPYLPTMAKERTPQWINYALDGGVSGRETIDRFLKTLSDHLRPGGRALLLISSLTGLKEVQETAIAGRPGKTEAKVGVFLRSFMCSGWKWG